MPNSSLMKPKGDDTMFSKSIWAAVLLLVFPISAFAQVKAEVKATVQKNVATALA